MRKPELQPEPHRRWRRRIRLQRWLLMHQQLHLRPLLLLLLPPLF